MTEISSRDPAAGGIPVGYVALSKDETFTPRQKAPPVKAGMNGAGSGFAQANPAIKDATAVKPWSFTN